MKFLLEPPGKTHGTSNSANGFITPPLDGTLTVSELYDFHLKNNPDHPVFLFAKPSGEIQRISFSEVVPAAHNAARFVARTTGICLESAIRPRPTIAILAMTDTITFFTTALGMLRAEIPIFPISPRNSLLAVVHLLLKIQPSHMLVSTEVAIQELARNAVQQLNDQNVPIICSMPTFEDIYFRDDKFVPLPPRARDMSATRFIIHSSGSTSFPKPIAWNDRSYLQVAMVPWFGAHDLCGVVFGCHALAMYHGMGLKHIAWLASTGLTMATFPPVSPAVTPTPEAVWSGLLATSPSFAFSPPVFFEGWSHDPSKIPFLKRLKGIVYGGAPLQKAVGDRLANAGVAIYTLYGSTETGVIGAIFPENPGLDWEYLSLNAHCAAEFIPIGDGTYELVVIAKPTTTLSVVNTVVCGEDAYATNDILVPHASKPGRWKVLGRKDDQIMLNTGEKTNPGPLEAILCQHSSVSSAVMFGRGKFQNGVLVELKEGHSFDPQDLDRLTKFRDDLRPQIEKVNATAPTHSRLFKEMVIVASPKKPFIYTPKGAPRRATILAEYSDEIEAVYADVGKSGQIALPEEWSLESLLSFVRAAVHTALACAAGDHEDIFERGCDSLQAVWIRQCILHALNSTAGYTNAQNASTGFVYENPTILSMAKYILSLLHSLHEGPQTVAQATNIESFLAPYITGLSKHESNMNASGANTWPDMFSRQLHSLSGYIPLLGRYFENPGQDVVLITGTTGALGSAILAKLVASESVRKIYAFNRHSRQGISIVERQEEALRSRGYDPDLARSPKVILVEGELTRAGLQINDALREEIRKSITHILHIAWRVDFNLSLASFATAVGGVRALVDLALSSPNSTPPRVLFTSSVGVLRNATSEGPVPETALKNPSVALGQGYSESKWVAEQILYEAAKHTALRPIVVRVGQISGGVNGAWNTSDWVPAIVKSSLNMGFLPEIKGTCSWIPLDFAAEAIAELRRADIATATAHLTHPHPLGCSSVFKAIGEELGLPLRPYAEWMEVLESLADNTDDEYTIRVVPSSDKSALDKFSDTLPAAKSLNFYQAGLEREDESRDAMGIPKLDITRALAASKTLREDGVAKKLVPDDIRLWLKYWKAVGFIV